jgi:acetolactate synthase-1/2/3 large subunit
VQRPVCADAGAFIREFMRQVGAIDKIQFEGWMQRCADWKTRYPVVNDEHRKATGAVSIFNFADVVGRQVGPRDQIVVGSSGAGIEIFLFACPTLHSQRLYHTAGLGAMGYCIPSAIAVAVAHPGKRVIAVDGDGGFMFNVQELETIARLRLPIKVFVLNNDGYSSIRASQRAYFGKATIGADRDTGLTVPDLQRIGESYGLQTYRIDDQTNLERDVATVLDMDGAVICDLRVLPDEMRGPRVQSHQKPDGSFVSRPLEDLYPFLPRDEFHANMIVDPLPE